MSNFTATQEQHTAAQVVIDRIEKGYGWASLDTIEMYVTDQLDGNKKHFSKVCALVIAQVKFVDCAVTDCDCDDCENCPFVN